MLLVNAIVGGTMNAQLKPTVTDATLQRWMNLEELEQLALSGGCTRTEFARASDMLGKHPVRIARYLKRHSFVPVTFAIPEGGHFKACA